MYVEGCNVFNSFLASSDLSSADKLCKQSGPRSGPTEHHVVIICVVSNPIADSCNKLSKSKSFDTMIVFLKEFFEKVNLISKKVSRGKQKHEKLPSNQ